MRAFKFMAIAILILQTALAQQGPFGKNKVQYKNFNWYFIRTEHFDIYFTDGGYSLAEYTAKIAEESYKKISKLLNYEIMKRIPIMVYNSHNDFQQTNVVQEYLEEGIGGVTELFKNRVVIPFEGSYRQFRHVIHHELVHAVLNDMFYGGSIQSMIVNNIQLQLPLWMNEGLAEFSALRWDVNSDMFMRDATINNYLPPINYLYGYFAYRGGQSVWWYISRRYGDEKIGEIMNKIKGLRSVEQGIKSALGYSLKELSERWQKELKKIYWPDVAKYEDPEDFARRLTNHKRHQNFYNTSPAISPSGDKIAFISDRDDYFDIFIMSAIDGKIIKKVVKGNRTKNFEELHLLTPKITWSPDGRKIAIAVKSGERDAIFIIDIKNGKKQKITFDLDGIFSVDWSRDGTKLAFVGNKLSKSDIYVYDLKNKTLINLTNDVFSDATPVWAPDGKTIYFSSDRQDYTSKDKLPPNFKMYNFDPKQYDIYAIDIETRKIRRITDTDNWDETSPVVSPDGKKLLFISNRNGINNIYVKDLETGEERPITNSISGIYQISISYDGSKLAFSAFNDGGFDIYLLRSPLDRDLKVAELEPTEFVKELTQKRTELAEETLKQETKQKENNEIINLYGEGIKINLKNYVFADIFKEDSLAESMNVSSDSLKPPDNIDENGRYKVYKYKVNFTPDIIYSNASYNTFFGVQGEALMMFSDMLGNHQIIIQTSMVLDLKNSDYAFAYFYLPKRVDYGIQFFHIARFLQTFDFQTFQSFFYRFRAFGGTFMASYPFDKFNRLDFSLDYLTLVRETIDNQINLAQRKSVLMPSLTYVHDNSLWGYLAPANGERYYISAYGSPRFSKDALQFASLILDYRRYFRLWPGYSLAFRFTAGGSIGRNPEKFMLGGVDSWINRRFEGGTIPIEDAEDFIFLTPVVPLRGYNYNARLGSKFALLNLEFRFPFIRYIIGGAFPLQLLQNTMGVAFVDIGSTWNDWKNWRAFYPPDPFTGLRTKDLLIGTGFGIRFYLFYFIFRLDVAWRFTWDKFSKPVWYISLGPDF